MSITKRYNNNEKMNQIQDFIKEILENKKNS